MNLSSVMTTQVQIQFLFYVFMQLSHAFVMELGRSVYDKWFMVYSSEPALGCSKTSVIQVNTYTDPSYLDKLKEKKNGTSQHIWPYLCLLHSSVHMNSSPSFEFSHFPFFICQRHKINVNYQHWVQEVCQECGCGQLGVSDSQSLLYTAWQLILSDKGKSQV